MYLVVIAWLYVTLMMAVAEAASPDGTLLGAFFTFALYGALPLVLVVYLMGAPGRSRALKAAACGEREADAAARDDAQRAAALAAGAAAEAGVGAGAVVGAASPSAPTDSTGTDLSALPPDAGREAAAGAEPGGIAAVGEKL